MATVSAPRPRVRTKPALSVALTTPPDGPIPGVLHLAHGLVEGTAYFVRPQASDFGTAFRLDKIQGGEEPYFVNVNGQQSTCECLGFLRWQKPCKHIIAIRQLVEGGAL